jgi:hypothetical protein
VRETPRPGGVRVGGHGPTARVNLTASGGTAIAAGGTVDLATATVLPLPVASRPLTLRWNLLGDPVPEVEPFDAGDTAMLALLVAAWTAADDAEARVLVAVLVGLMLWPLGRAVLLAALRRMQGR